jgi:hypothetical protein
MLAQPVANLSSQEMFVQYLTGEAQNMTKLERKPRRNIQYKDIGKITTLLHSPCQFLPLE